MSDDFVARPVVGRVDVGPSCFWSYARNDDARIGGKLGAVSQDLARFYEFETGRPLAVFRDVHDIRWGQSWADRISHGLRSVTFLVPAITPNFLVSEMCRAEVRRFDAICRARGVRDSILPIVFSGRHLIRADSDDDIVRILAAAQCFYFDELWFTDRSGEPWMRAVRDMVRQLVSIESATAERLGVFSPRAATGLSPTDVAGGDDGPRVAPEQRLADLSDELDTSAERAIGHLADALEKLNVVAERIGAGVNGRRAASDAPAGRADLSRIAVSLDGPGRAFGLATASCYEATLETDALLRDVQQLGGLVADPAFGAGFDRSIVTALGDPAILITVIDGVDDLLPGLAEVERRSPLLAQSLQPVRTGMRVLRDTTDIILSWQDAAARRLTAQPES